MNDVVENKIYTIDADWLIQFSTHYPIDIAPDFWEHLLTLIAEGRVFICDPVYQEIMQQDDDLSQWLQANINGAHIEEPSGEDFDFVRDRIMSQYEEKFSRWFGLEDPNGLDADPFLVATAATRGYVVVTGEGRKLIQKGSPVSKVPNACDEFGVECICTNRQDRKQSPIVDFFRDSGFRK